MSTWEKGASVNKVVKKRSRNRAPTVIVTRNQRHGAAEDPSFDKEEKRKRSLVRQTREGGENDLPKEVRKEKKEICFKEPLQESDY